MFPEEVPVVWYIQTQSWNKKDISFIHENENECVLIISVRPFSSNWITVSLLTYFMYSSFSAWNEIRLAQAPQPKPGLMSNGRAGEIISREREHKLSPFGWVKSGYACFSHLPLDPAMLCGARNEVTCSLVQQERNEMCASVSCVVVSYEWGSSM